MWLALGMTLTHTCGKEGQRRRKLGEGKEQCRFRKLAWATYTSLEFRENFLKRT